MAEVVIVAGSPFGTRTSSGVSPSGSTTSRVITAR